MEDGEGCGDMHTSEWNALATFIGFYDEAVTNGGSDDYREGWRDALRKVARSLEPWALTDEEADKIIVNGRIYRDNGFKWPVRDNAIRCTHCGNVVHRAFLIGKAHACDACREERYLWCETHKYSQISQPCCMMASRFER